MDTPSAAPTGKRCDRLFPNEVYAASQTPPEGLIAFRSKREWDPQVRTHEIMLLCSWCWGVCWSEQSAGLFLQKHSCSFSGA